MSPYKQLWKVVEGSVKDAFNRHPDYLTPKGRKSARASITKRVTGTVLSFAVQAAESQRKLAETAVGNATPDRLGVDVRASASGDGALHASSSPDPHCRIVRVRFKRKSRYRSPDAFNLTTSRLLAVAAPYREGRGKA